MKILITGGTGFVGNALVSSLKKSHDKLRIATRKEASEKSLFKVDLLNQKEIGKACQGMDAVVHLAFSKNYPENIVMMENLIHAAKKAKVKKIVLLSSMSAKRKHPDSYGKIKLHLENLLQNSKIEYTILRPSIIYGKRSTSFNFMINYMKKIPIFVPIIGSGKYKFAPVHISDVVSSIKRCIENKRTNGKVYDLPGGEEVYFLDVVNTLKSELGMKKINLHVPILFCNLIALVIPKIVSRENIKNLTEDSLADGSLARKDFDYNPIKFKEGVKNGLI